MSAARNANHMRMQAALVQGLLAKPKFGLATSWDPDNHLVKVMLQPEEIETGWMPLEVTQAGAGWGVYAAPQIGDQAVIHFHEGDKEHGWCTGFLPNDVDKPPHVPAGEIHLIHKTGQFVKLLTDGSISLSTGSGGSIASVLMKPDGTIASTGAWTHTGTLHVTDDVTLDKALNVAGAVSFAGSSVTHGGINIGKTHVHAGVTAGSANTAVPH